MSIKTLIRGAAAAALALGLCAACLAESPMDKKRREQEAANRLRSQISFAEYHVRQFEQEVARARGGQKQIWREKKGAMDSVQKLKIEFPNDERVEKLYQRVRVALMKSMGEYTEMHPEWLAYRRNEEDLRKFIAQQGQEKWDALVAEHKAETLDRAFPAPDFGEVTLDEVKGRYVVLDSVEYPRNQFYGATGEYIACGKPSTGYYFVDIAKRQWLGPYEAVKRFRRGVDTELADVQKWQLLGQITDITAEIPEAGEEKVGPARYGWVVTPVALFVPGHVAAWYDASGEATGAFAGEDKVDEIKNAWYTVKEIPADATPERVMEIFMTAIKEKNYQLYHDCIDPIRRSSEVGEDLLRYHWDRHQERFHGQYVHATFDSAKISVVKGYDNRAENQENFFLDDKQKETLTKIMGKKIENAEVESISYDENGHRLGQPQKHYLRRTDGGPWYVYNFDVRF